MDVAYQWLRFFLEDDDKLNEIGLVFNQGRGGEGRIEEKGRKGRIEGGGDRGGSWILRVQFVALPMLMFVMCI